ncbi:GtrA family protein [Pseudomonas sp. NPDC088444]|uniref:GtrA family protein n=1 Tax=Pseudomonas sp. NPDC088444 TaxID=3364456 RepID=UPI00384EBDC0
MSGGINTALTYGMYLILLNWLDYKTSYSLSYLTGIVLAYLLNRYFVFGTHQGIRSFMGMPIIYLTQYLSSMGIIWVWVEIFRLDERIAPLISTIMTIPITFALSKIFFAQARAAANTTSERD